MPNFINKKMMEELKHEFDGLSNFLLVNLQGLSVEDVNNLRAGLSEWNLKCHVVKNRIALLALESQGIKGFKDLIKGATALVYGNEEAAIQAAKVVSDKMKGMSALQIKGAYLDGAILDAKQAKELSTVPSKTELFSMILGAVESLRSAPAALVNALVSKPAQLAQAYEEKLGNS